MTDRRWHGSDLAELVQHLLYDHGWTQADLRHSPPYLYEELEEMHDKNHASDLDPHRAGTK